MVYTLFPPLLPTVLLVSVGISANRLKSKRITCLNPEKILEAGKCDCVFFDKTGTMTVPGMEFVSLGKPSG
jgi:cation-transporting P-type ATPase 13A2